MEKSTMISVGEDDVISRLANEMGCRTEKLPFTYLGMPIGAHWRSGTVWEHVLLRMQQKLATWKKKKLNKAGRLVLIKSYLSSLPIYYLSMFHLPASIENKMIKIMRNFLWGAVEGQRKLIWVGWPKICVPKACGGLGIRILRIMNQALLVKWVWKFTRNKHSLWRKLMCQKFRNSEAVLLPAVDTSSQCRSQWRNMVRMIPLIQSFTTFTVNNGKGIRFWKDAWTDRGCLCDIFPALFKVVKDKDATIAECLGEQGWNFSLKRVLDDNQRLEWDLLRRDLAVPNLQEEEDVVVICGQTNSFSTQACYEKLAGDYEVCSFTGYLWKVNIPQKVSFLLWAVFHNSLPTRDMLRIRNVDIVSDQCVLCNASNETADHLLMHCSFSTKIWVYFFKAFRLEWTMPAHLLSLFDAWKTNVLQGRAKKVWMIIHYVICWILWNERNSRVFGGRKKTAEELIDQVKYTVVLWSCDSDTFSFVNHSLIWSSWETLMHM